jgi:hypothetical protein
VLVQACVGAVGLKIIIKSVNMSDNFKSIRNMAVNVAVEEWNSNVGESNQYPAIIDLHLANGQSLENRGERVDEYLRTAGVSVFTMNHPDTADHSYRDDRQWCGMFVYYCYSEAARRCGRFGALPFNGSDLWSGIRLRAWADAYGHKLQFSKQTIQNAFNKDLADQDLYKPGFYLDQSVLDRYAGIQQDKKTKSLELSAVDDLLGFRIWDKLNGFSAADAARVVVLAGDIFAVDSGHVGIASSDSQGGLFSTIEGNQSELNTPGKPSIVNNYGKSKRSVNGCNLIIRI